MATMALRGLTTCIAHLSRTYHVAVFPCTLVHIGYVQNGNAIININGCHNNSTVKWGETARKTVAFLMFIYA